MTDIKSLLATMQIALKHVIEVQKDVTELNHSAMHLLNDEIFESNLNISDDAFVALQHQDILTQQLSATNELLEVINQHIDQGSINELEMNIFNALEVSRIKRDAFSGNAFDMRHESSHELVTS